MNVCMSNFRNAELGVATLSSMYVKLQECGIGRGLRSLERTYVRTCTLLARASSREAAYTWIEPKRLARHSVHMDRACSSKDTRAKRGNSPT